MSTTTTATHTISAESAKPDLDVLNYEKIKNRDPKELERLVQAGQPDGGNGLFFLDIQGPTAGDTLAESQELYGHAANFFHKPLEEKNVFHKEGVDDGFNAHGAFEVFEILRDESVAGTVKLPADLEAVKPNFSRFLSQFDNVIRDLYQAFGSALEPQDPLATTSDMASDTSLQLAWARPGTEEGKLIAPAHTDRGLLTLIYYDAPTLEVPIQGTDDWRVVKPLEGALVGHVGKGLELSSEGRLVAGLHRVVAPGREAFALAYLLRPAFA